MEQSTSKPENGSRKIQESPVRSGYSIDLGLSPKSGTLRYHRFESHLINGFFGQELIDRHILSGEKYLGYSEVDG